VLRFWESRFTQIRPLKRGGGRRYYRPDDVDLLRGVRHLLYGEGYTIRGVQRILREEGLSFVQSVWRTGAEQSAAAELEDEDEAKSAGDLEGEDESEAGAEGEDVSEDEGEAEASSRPREPSFFPGPSTTAARAEQRREPKLAPPAAAPTRLEGQQKLRAALEELVACRSLIQAVLTGTPLPEDRPDAAS
jgi:DNA-binding transcriptional MerR regulator